MKLDMFAAFALLLATSAGSAHASLGGIATDPLGDRDSAFVQYATWDILAASGTGVISNLAAQSGDLAFTLSQSATGSFPYGNPGTTDQFYTFTRATSWTLSGTASILTNEVVLQIRLSPPAAGSSTTTEQFLAPLLNGLAAVSAQKIATGLDPDPDGFATNGFDVMEWRWSDLNIAAGQTFAITFGNAAGGYHVAFDSFAVDVSAVPEPSAYGLMGVALAALVVWRHRRQRAGRA